MKSRVWFRPYPSAILLGTSIVFHKLAKKLLLLLRRAV